MPDDPNPVGSPVEPDGTAEGLAAALQQTAEAAEGTVPPVEPSPTEPVAPPVAADPVADPVADPAADPAAEDRPFSALMDDFHGLNLREKYGNDAAARAGVAEAVRMVGRRDADAEYGRAMRQHEVAFQQYLQQQSQAQQPQQSQAQQPSGQPSAVDDLPPAVNDLPSEQQLALWREQVARDGDNAPLDARMGLERYPQQVHRLIRQMAVQSSRQEADRQEALGQQQQVAQQVYDQKDAILQERTWVSNFEQQNVGWIYHGGQVGEHNLTPDGQRLLQYARLEQQRGRNSAEALHYAHQAMLVERYQQEQPPQRTQAVKPAAQHQPAVAAPAGGDPQEEYKQDLEKFGGQPDGLSNHLAKLFGQRQAAAGQLG